MCRPILNPKYPQTCNPWKSNPHSQYISNCEWPRKYTPWSTDIQPWSSSQDINYTHSRTNLSGMVIQSSATVPGGGLWPSKNNLVFILFVTIMKAILYGWSPYNIFKWDFKFSTSSVHTVWISPSPTPSLYITICCGRAPPLYSLYFWRASAKQNINVLIRSWNSRIWK